MIRIESKKKDELLEKACAAAYDFLGLKGLILVEVEVVGAAKIRRINADFRGVDKPTDVLSFPSLSLPRPQAVPVFEAFNAENYPFETGESGEVMLGSIVICEAVAKKQAAEYGHSVERERAFLLVHGLLHLLGFDHEEEADRAVMRQKEESILAQIGQKRD